MRGSCALTLAFIVPIALVSGCGKSGAPVGEEKKEAAPPVVVTLAAVTSGPIEETVTARGTLQPDEGKSARVAAASAGRIVRVTVREGDAVSAGQLVATLDDRPQRALAAGAGAAVAAANAQVGQTRLAAEAAAQEQLAAVRTAQLALDSAKVDTAGALQAAQTALDLAQSDLERVQAGARPQEIAQAEAARRQAEATRARAATEAERTAYLFEKGVTARRQADDAATALAVAQGALDAATQQIALLKDGARPEERQAAELRVRQAREALGQARSSGAARQLQAEAALRQARQGVLTVAAKRQEALAGQAALAQKLAESRGALLQTSLADIRAPFAGVVTKRSASPGDVADPATPILEIADLRTLALIASLPAAEGARVRAGMPATLTLEGGATVRARVRRVGQVDPQTGLLAVRLAVDNEGGRLKVGAFATAKIVVRREARAALVPRAALVSDDDKAVVFTVGADGKAHKKEVTVGVETDALAEVRKGLQPGAKVVVEGAYALTDGAAVDEAEKKDPEK